MILHTTLFKRPGKACDSLQKPNPSLDTSDTRLASLRSPVFSRQRFRQMQQTSASPQTYSR